MSRVHQAVARGLLAAMACALAGPLAAGAAAAPAGGQTGISTCAAGKELQQRRQRVHVRVRTASGHVRRRTRLRKRWVCAADTTAPDRVAGLVAVPGDGRIVVTWTASQDAGGVAGYEVYRDGRYVVTINDTTFTDPSLPNGTAHQYRVFAVDMARNLSAPSGVVWAMPRAQPDREAPGMPVGLAAAADPAALKVTLTWGAPSDDKGVTSYRVYRDGALVGTSTTPGYVDADLAHKTEYRYAVVALDAAGNQSQQTPVVSTYVS